MSQSMYRIEGKGTGHIWMTMLTYFCPKEAETAMSRLKDRERYRIKEIPIPEEVKK